MSINILMPALSPTMTEGKLAKWHVKVGDAVKSGQVICEIETDKATMEVEAVDEGKIGQIVVPEGTEGVKVNAVDRRPAGGGRDRGAGGAARRSRRRKPRRSQAAPAPQAGRPQRLPPSRAGAPQPRRRSRQRRRAASASSPRRSPSASRRTRASISRASRARGPNGRIVKADVESAKPGRPRRRRPRRRRPLRRRGAAAGASRSFTAPGDQRVPHTADAQGHRAAHARVQADGAALLPDGGLRDRCAAGGARGDQRRGAQEGRQASRSTTW